MRQLQPLEQYIPPITVSARDIQRGYRDIFDKAKKQLRPIFVLRNNKLDVAIVDAYLLESLAKRAQAFEEAQAIEAVKVYEKEKRAGKLRKLQGISNLWPDED
ncbi:MAG: hypothetical protein FJ044_01010 [Candidatus Cloacimonetes bacterium]|nr:hypothetical protein [Candidatus Cloacimonadota bacterium]